MKVSKQKLFIAMARACMDSADLAKASGMPRPTVNNAITGRNVRPATVGKIAKALCVDPAEIVAVEE